jgi:hypothetical protein
MKSVACRACKEDCTKCGYAYPEFYRPLKLPGSILRALNLYADERKLDASVFVSDLILEKINAK